MAGAPTPLSILFMVLAALALALILALGIVELRNQRRLPEPWEESPFDPTLSQVEKLLYCDMRIEMIEDIRREAAGRTAHDLEVSLDYWRRTRLAVELGVW